jgi:hypothetical protein
MSLERWEKDDSLVARIESLDWRQRYQTAVLALRRLRAPVLEIAMPAEWGIPLDLVSSIFATLTAEPSNALADAIHTAADELQTAPLFSSEWDPGLTQEVQLETIGALLRLNDRLMDLDVDSAEYIVYKTRAMTTYLDEFVADSLTPNPAEDTHQRYHSQLGDEVGVYGLDYFGSRNIELELACHAGIVQQSPDEGFFSSAAGRELLELCGA